MSLITLPNGRWESSAVLIMSFILYLAVCAQFVQMTSANNADSGNTSITMTFHMRSLVFSNSVSMFIYNGADTNPPTYSTPVTALVSCSSSPLDFQQFLPSGVQTWLSSGNVWFGGVSWITQPLAEDLTVRGNASITAWMSSSDTNVAESGYVFGIAESDSMANIVGAPTYDYYSHSGNVLASTRSPYQLSFSVDRTFARGNIMAFFVGVGSSSKGMQYQVYFDSSATNSFVELPAAGAPVAEFSQTGTLAAVSFAMVASLVLMRRRKQQFT